MITEYELTVPYDFENASRAVERFLLRRSALTPEEVRTARRQPSPRTYTVKWNPAGVERTLYTVTLEPLAPLDNFPQTYIIVDYLREGCVVPPEDRIIFGRDIVDPLVEFFYRWPYIDEEEDEQEPEEHPLDLIFERMEFVQRYYERKIPLQQIADETGYAYSYVKKTHAAWKVRTGRKRRR